MENLKHTQGEWSASGLEIRHKNRSLILANVYEHLPSNQSREEAEANAKLMAASSLMIDALIEAKRCMIERLIIDYSEAGADEETAKRMAEKDIKKFLLFEAINKATN